MSASHFFAPKSLPWNERLAIIVETMREMSRQSDPQVMAQVYGRRMRHLMPTDRWVALSRRDLTRPEFRVTRDSRWTDQPNPWKEKERLPKLSGGLFAELVYGNEPRLLNVNVLPKTDPAHPYVEGMQSILAIPHYDGGEGLNMIVQMRTAPEAFDPEELPELVWVSNLYGRATHNLVLAGQVKAAFEAVDAEMKTIADLQRSLLPSPLPQIPTMNLAAHYQTSQRAGGDYFDFFPLPGGQWGILIADVSGHGTPAAVLMAVTHTIAHTYPGPPTPPGKLLAHLNQILAERYTAQTGAFVTAFYAIYDPKSRSLRYASAGHPPPRLKRCADGSLALFDQVQSLPLGIVGNEEYPDASHDLVPGDQIVFYTDGVTEAENTHGEQFGLARLDAVLANCAVGAPDLLKEVLRAHDAFTAGKPAVDDRTILVAKIS
jgi:sigma-B regulation protein RsbU (phosphoserine phosphatase)